MPELSVELKNLEDIIKSAGRIVLSYFRRAGDVWEKMPLHVVTQADLASEQFLIKELTALISGSGVIAEERGSIAGNDYCWVIDPLDGTNNFAHGIGYFCISVALMYQNKVVVAAIYDPVADEFFYAALHQGSLLNHKPITIGPIIGSPMLSFAYIGAEEYHNLVTKIPVAYTFRHLGAAALDLAYVASGRLNGMLSQGLSWWDIAAGALLVQEAGGIVTDFSGNNIGQISSSCLAANPELYPLLATMLRE